MKSIFTTLERITNVWKSIFTSLQHNFTKQYTYWIQEHINIRQSKCLLTGKWIDYGIRTIGYYTVIKINELWFHSSAWMNFKVFK